MGGPYSNREDAERAIRAGSFDQDPAELMVMESDSGEDGTSRQARKTAAWGPFETPTTDAAPGPSTPEVPDLADPVPDQLPKTTKPAQTPGGSGGLPQDPMSPQFDPGPTSTPGPDPLASTTASVVEEIRAANPGVDSETLIRVASRAVAKLVEADFDPSSMRPHIEDPLRNKTPWQVVKDVKETLPDKEDEEEGEDETPDDEGGGDGKEDDGGSGGDSGGGSSLPHLPRALPLPNLGGAGAGAGAAEGAGAAAEGAGIARMLPLLMV
ncbi:MAG TPA: hypothetical protein VHA75_00170 [Rugosimonospora sp.]|nr:hypothetical protein [Rugosimonospora sp.]